MSSFRVRPKFRQVVPGSAEAVQARLVATLKDGCEHCRLKSFPGYLSLRVPEEKAHFWSPQLSLTLEAVDAEQTLVEGTYGPNANVWSLFLYGYLVIGSVGLFAAVLGVSQRIIGHSAWGLWLAAAMAVLAGALYMVAQFGQKLAAWQTYQLHRAYESAMGQPVEVH